MSKVESGKWKEERDTEK